MGGGRFVLKLFSLLICYILRLCIDIKIHGNPGISKKNCGGGGSVVICEFSVLLWSKPFSLKLKIWTWTKPNKT